jgi:hypothetical protein
VAEFDCVGDDLALGVCIDKFEAAVGIHGWTNGEMAILFCWQFVLLFVLPALVTFCQFVWGRTFW